MSGDSSLFVSLVITSVVLTWLSFISCGVSLFSPSWITTRYNYSVGGGTLGYVANFTAEVQTGLLVYCTTSNVEEAGALKGCTWFKETGSAVADWVAVTRALVAGSTCIYLLAAACSNVLFFTSLRNPECSSLLLACHLLGLGSIIAAVVVFETGARADNNVQIERAEGVHFDWGYYIAIIAAGVSLCAFLMAGVVITLITRKGHIKYKEANMDSSKA